MALTLCGGWGVGRVGWNMDQKLAIPKKSKCHNFLGTLREGLQKHRGIWNIQMFCFVLFNWRPASPVQRGSESILVPWYDKSICEETPGFLEEVLKIFLSCSAPTQPWYLVCARRSGRAAIAPPALLFAAGRYGRNIYWRNQKKKWSFARREKSKWHLEGTSPSENVCAIPRPWRSGFERRLSRPACWKPDFQICKPWWRCDLLWGVM